MNKDKLTKFLLKARAKIYEGLEGEVEPVLSESAQTQQQPDTGLRHYLNIIREFIVHLMKRFYKPTKRFILSIYETTIGTVIRGLKS